jgi:hypothetical protein
MYGSCLSVVVTSSILIILLVGSMSAFPRKSRNELRRRIIEVDPEGRYVVGFEVDLDSSEILIDVTVQTTGFVGFGISDGGGMAGKFKCKYMYKYVHHLNTFTIYLNTTLGMN